MIKKYFIIEDFRNGRWDQVWTTRIFTKLKHAVKFIQDARLPQHCTLVPMRICEVVQRKHLRLTGAEKL